MALIINIRSKTSRTTLTANTDHRATLTIGGRAVRTQEKTVTPSDVAQRIQGDPGYLLRAVLVEPVPSYYGRIAYDGGKLNIY